MIDQKLTETIDNNKLEIPETTYELMLPRTTAIALLELSTPALNCTLD
jgi:hypothetical protein